MTFIRGEPCAPPRRRLALFHRFDWLQETVEHILVTDGQMEAAVQEEEQQAEEESHQGHHDAPLENVAAS